MDCSLPGFSFHGIFQASLLEWVAISSPRDLPDPWDRTQVSRIAGRHFTLWATILSAQKGDKEELTDSHIHKLSLLLYLFSVLFSRWILKGKLLRKLQGSKELVYHERLKWASQVVLVVKNLPANAGDIRDSVLIPGSGRSPGGGGAWRPTPVFLPGESHGQRTLVG